MILAIKNRSRKVDDYMKLKLGAGWGKPMNQRVGYGIQDTGYGIWDTVKPRAVGSTAG